MMYLNRPVPIPTVSGVNAYKYGEIFSRLHGLEIGGPSPAWVPTEIYSKPASLDNLVFSSQTLWAKFDRPDYIFQGKTIPGRILIDDAVSMRSIEEDSYDFVFASHVLEHIVNPLKFMKSIRRILRPNGFILLALPWKDATFDHRRPITQFSDLEMIYSQDRGEGDCLDIARFAVRHYDFLRDPAAGGEQAFLERCMSNLSNRAFHVHVYDFPLIYAVLDYIDFEPLSAELVAPYHQVVLARGR
jgi:SAM-dependent methyltransferase